MTLLEENAARVVAVDLFIGVAVTVQDQVFYRDITDPFLGSENGKEGRCGRLVFTPEVFLRPAAEVDLLSLHAHDGVAYDLPQTTGVGVGTQHDSTTGRKTGRVFNGHPILIPIGLAGDRRGVTRQLVQNRITAGAANRDPRSQIQCVGHLVVAGQDLQRSRTTQTGQVIDSRLQGPVITSLQIATATDGQGQALRQRAGPIVGIW